MLHLDKLDSMSAQVIISLAIILIAGFLMTRITKKLRLPNVTGYIISVSYTHLDVYKRQALLQENLRDYLAFYQEHKE